MDNLDQVKDIITKHTLANAVKFDGKASQGAVIGKLMSECPEIKKDMKEASKLIQEILKDINSWPLAKQSKVLEEKYPEMLEKKIQKERDIFAFLEIDESQPVVSAFPPGPEKYPHIGHAKACMLNYLLAKRYNGKFLLRFEDTNPDLVKAQFYDIMLENLTWLGARWDDLLYASDHMQLYYDCAETLISKGEAYMCTCTSEQIKEGRAKALPCRCRANLIDQNLSMWKQFDSMKEGDAILRLKIDLGHKNSTMKDPTIFRIIETPHARHGTKYRVWPNYDFQNAIIDSYTGVTIRLRSKEFEMRSELQRYIQNALGLRATRTYEFGRFNMEGVLSSGRIIREKVNNGELIGWDDPSLTTLVALRRRGFLPEAIVNFIVSTGITKAESTLTWDDLIVHNKRLLDATAKRYFFIEDKIKISIHNAPSLKLNLDLHPDNDKGGRLFHTNNEFYIERHDYDDLKDGDLIRLMDCLNFRKDKDKFIFISTDIADYRKEGKKIIHWLPADNKQTIEVNILMPDKTVKVGIAEKTANTTRINDVIQFQRFGFVRLDKKEDKLNFWYTHK